MLSSKYIIVINSMNVLYSLVILNGLTNYSCNPFLILNIFISFIIFFNFIREYPHLKSNFEKVITTQKLFIKSSNKSSNYGSDTIYLFNCMCFYQKASIVMLFVLWYFWVETSMFVYLQSLYVQLPFSLNQFPRISIFEFHVMSSLSFPSFFKNLSNCNVASFWNL